MRRWRRKSRRCSPRREVRRLDARARDNGEREARGRREIERLRAMAHVFDQAFTIPGTHWRFGVDALFGLIPGLGDLFGALVAMYALNVAWRLRAPVSI